MLLLIKMRRRFATHKSIFDTACSEAGASNLLVADKAAFQTGLRRGGFRPRCDSLKCLAFGQGHLRQVEAFTNCSALVLTRQKKSHSTIKDWSEKRIVTVIAPSFSSHLCIV